MTCFRTYRHFVLLGILGLWLVTNTESVADNSFAAQVSVYFSLPGGCTEAIVRELGAAHKQVLMQAYSWE